MKKPVKLLLIVLAVVVGLLLALVLAIGVFGGRIVKKAVEVAGTKTLKVPVAVSDAGLSILGGSLTLQGLQIDNPPGYQHPKLLQLKDARVEVNVRSLLSDKVKIRQIRLDGMDLVLEQKGMGSNLQDIIHNLPKSEQQQGSELQGKALEIEDLEITNVTVLAKMLPLPGKADTVTLKLAPIRMTNLGTDSKLDAAALTGKVLVAIAAGIVEQGTNLLPKDLVGGVGSALGATTEAGKAVLKGATDVGKGITGLFSRKKQKQ